jgi:Xaa-Pro dipeptidase
MKNRIKNIFENLGKKAPDAIMFNYSSIRDYSFFYATGLVGGSFEGSTAIIFPDGNCTALIPQLEENIATKENTKNNLGLDLRVFKSGKEHIEFLKKGLKGVRDLGVDFTAMSIATKKRIDEETKVKFTDISAIMRDARAVKDGIEIGRIKKAIEIAEKGMEKTLKSGILKIGVSENEVAAELGYRMQKIGGSQSFPTIVAFGKNGAEPHHSTGDSKLKKNELVLIDWGAKYERYCSDITRTFVFGKINEKQKRMLEIVKEARQIGFDKICEGAEASSVHMEVLHYIDRSEFKGKFVHSTGHTLGLQVHDGKTLGNEKFALKEGMVLTVEPGVYVSGVGGVRIEDDVLVTKKGMEKLSKSKIFFEL